MRLDEEGFIPASRDETMHVLRTYIRTIIADEFHLGVAGIRTFDRHFKYNYLIRAELARALNESRSI